MKLRDWIWCKIHWICPKHLIKESAHFGCDECNNQARENFEERIERLKQKHEAKRI